ncbi:MAG: 2-iminobutanoate/2-iminopropanoate deaminase [Gammaproteobacteria bacterium]|jgi:2-iminobutanoate/2-iminopropanoate deaminase
MSCKIETSTPANTMRPIGPYSHIAKVGEFITIGGTAGVDPVTGELAGADITSQTTQILDAFEVMLASVGSDLEHVIHINIFFANMDDFEAMNSAYAKKMGDRRPARTAIAVTGLPKKGALLTMNLTAVTKE